jgi:excisionase family DNA binding protein
MNTPDSPVPTLKGPAQMNFQPQKIERRALRPKEAAKAYGVSRTLIYDWMKTGKLASVRLGGARLIAVDALEALISAAD